MKKKLFYTEEKNNHIKYIPIFVIFICIFFILYRYEYRVQNFIQNIYYNINFTKRMDSKMKIEKLPVWDLNDLYSSITDLQIDKDIKKLRNNIKEFEKKYKNEISTLSAGSFYMAVKKYENISELMGKLSSYSYLKYSESLAIEDNIKFYQKISEELTDLSSKLVFFTIEINKLSDLEIDTLLKSSRKLRREYSFYIETLRMFKKYQLSTELEEMLAQKSITGRQAWSRLFDETIDGMIFEYEGKKLNEAEILKILNDGKPEERKKAGKIFGEKLGENAKLLAYITNTLAKDKSITDIKRGYKSPISSRNLSNLIEDEVVDTMYKTVQKNYKNISHRYYSLKAKMMKQKKLHYTDRNAPLNVADNKTYSWDDAKKIVLDSYTKFSPEMAEIGKEFFDKKWIDAEVRQGKRGGAFMMPTTPKVHPYILLSYQGTSGDIKALAHELGHGVHQQLANSQGYFMSDTPLTLAETASVFGEQLVFRYLLENETDKNAKIAILSKKIEDAINTVIRQIAFLEFEQIVHTERRKGEISVDRLNEIWMSVQKNSLGDIFEYDEEYKYYWAYIPHFIHSPFYVYAYAFGECLVNSLYYQYLQKPEGFQDKYIKLLKAGGSKKYNDLLKPFNLDPKDEKFWQGGLNTIIELIDELENLLK